MAIAFVVVMGVLAFGTISRNVAAITTLNGYNGWAGNSAVYLTTGISAAPAYEVGAQWMNGSQPSSGNSLGVANALGLSTGGSNFYEYYVRPPAPASPYMYVQVPVVAASASQIVWNPAAGVAYQTNLQELDLGVAYSPYSSENILWGNNSGYNVTGTVFFGNYNNVPLWQWGADAAGFLPGVGYVTGGASLIMDYEKTIGTSPNNAISAGGNGQVYEEAVVVNPAKYQNVFVSQMLVEVRVYTDEWSYNPTIDLFGANLLGNSAGGQSTTGVSENILIPMEPAITLEGTIYAVGAPVPNSVISLSDGSTVYTFQANSQGNYRFFAKPGTAYTMTVTYGTTFGNAQIQKTFTTSTDPTSPALGIDLTLPVSYVQGQVWDASTHAGLYNAKVTVTSPAAVQTYVCTNSGGYYSLTTNGAGTYSMTVGAYTYYGASASPSFAANTTYSGPGFGLAEGGSSTGCGSPPGGGGGGGCILSGTQIAVAGGGTKAVNKIHIGDAVLGYNATTGTWVSETVASNSYTFVGQVLSIDNGLLETTLTDQPLYVRNGTWTGWVHDPQNLIPGEQLFLPTTGAWVNVTSLQILTDNFKVYDLRVTAPNDFVANGVLVGDKYPR